MSVDLEKLKAEITALGENIKQLKSSSGDKEAVDAAVKALLAAKKTYADNNNGIGVDGKPYEEPLSKAEKKAKAKAEKAANKEGEAKPVRLNETCILVMMQIVRFLVKKLKCCLLFCFPFSKETQTRSTPKRRLRKRRRRPPKKQPSSKEEGLHRANNKHHHSKSSKVSASNKSQILW